MRPVASATSLTFVLLALAVTGPAHTATETGATITAEAVSGLELRGIGPALMGGRIADIAVSPGDSSTWYLAVGSGGVWKTENAGITWRPIFDDQPSYSVGSVTLDPSNNDVVWVGTGENVSGRHVGWGDGVYKSLDGGGTWERMGLETSEHIGKIVVDPRDGNVVYVAAEGPLWSSGGERGLFKTTDGGETWVQVLSIDEDTGVTDVEMDPRNPDVLYAAAYQRRRQVWALLAGGPGTGIYKSTDGGESWREIETGLPKGDMGKIGLALSPADPDVVYATIEAAENERGFYRSLDRGESWERRNEYISNGTGPHYYQEIVASPHDVDTVYQMDVFLHVTRDGGKTFDILGSGREKHSDNHALVIDPEDPDHLIVGTDASLYESFDEGTTWRQSPNLPVSQFYKLALDTSEPFYNILGGAQDLGTLLGPSRTNNTEGVRSRDWYVPLGADGYACAFDPEEPHIAYMEWQNGRLQRYDRRTHELIDIQPLPAPGDPPERWNWDSPVLVSPHSSTRLYFGSQRLWRSDDRGDSWTAVSGDLTRDRNRYELEMSGRVRSIDALYGNTAMSWYGTLTRVSESPLVEGLLYVGTDDGLIQVSEDGGANWRLAGATPGVPEYSFVNDIQASLHDPDTVFAVLDAHKTGDYRPYVFESTDRGRAWRSIAGDLPATGIVWAVEQDHVDEELLFAGTESGVSFTPDGGAHWVELASGAPTISFRDIEIQRRDNDLVGATFGRGFYVLDDYSALREIAAGALGEDAALFPVRDAWWYVPLVPGQAEGQPSLGSSAFTAPNPPYGALFTYHLREEPKTAKETRREGEKELPEKGEDVPFPSWERLHDEALEKGPQVLLTVSNAEGHPVRRVVGSAEAGIHRVAWDLRLPPPDPVDLEVPEFRPPWASSPQGPFAPPGTYRVEMALLSAGGVEPLSKPQEFQVKPVPGAELTDSEYRQATAFQEATGELMRKAQGAAEELQRLEDRLRHLRPALVDTPRADSALFTRMEEIEASVADLRVRLMGDRIRGRWDEPSVPSVLQRISQVAGSQWDNRLLPTATQRQSLAVAQTKFAAVSAELSTLLETELPRFEADLEAAGAPWTPGRKLPPPTPAGSPFF
ncbi:MAG: glycosyl hydrolase [Thermoanaerobaculia bacterium]